MVTAFRRNRLSRALVLLFGQIFVTDRVQAAVMVNCTAVNDAALQLYTYAYPLVLFNATAAAASPNSTNVLTVGSQVGQPNPDTITVSGTTFVSSCSILSDLFSRFLRPDQ